MTQAVTTPEHLKHYEFGRPFTPAELRAIAEYEERIAGIPDSFTPVALAGTDTAAEVVFHVTALRNGLIEWRTSLDALREELGLVHSAAHLPHSVRVYLGLSIAAYATARNALAAAVLDYLTDMPKTWIPNPFDRYPYDGVEWVDGAPHIPAI